MRSPFNYRFGLPSPFYDSETGSFSPASLFALAEPGVWFDPSDLTTLFTDPAGTTPVTAPGNTVGLMLDKSKGLALGAELVANGDFSSAAGWTLTNASIGSGVLSATAPLNTTFASRLLTASMTAGRSYEVRLTVSNFTGGSFLVQIAGGAQLAALDASANGSYRALATATASHTIINLRSYGSGFTGTIDNISVRELAGNHATQATLTARPTYSIEPVGGRRNLLTWSDDFRTTAAAGETRPWNNLNAAITPNADGVADLLYPLTSGTLRAIERSIGAVSSAAYTASIEAKASGLNWFYLYGAQGNNFAHFNLSTGAVGTVGSGLTAAITGPDAGGYYRCTVTQTATNLNFAAGGCDANGSTQATASGTNGVLIRNAQLELGSTATAYQRVTTQYDVTEAGVASVSYLYFDGAGDFMFTSTITPATDKAQVFAGVRKLSDATVALLLETSANSNTNDGTLWLAMPISAGVASNSFRSKGTAVSEAYSTTPALVSAVVTGLGDISGDRATIRTNGVQSGQNTGDQGTGNYLAYPLFIGSRGNAGPPYTSTSLPFSGHLYSLITRFGPTLDAPTITSTEIWVGDKTGIDVAKNISTTIYTRSGDTILDRANSTIERRTV